MDAIEKAITALKRGIELLAPFQRLSLLGVHALSQHEEALQLLREHQSKQPSEGVWKDISTAPRDGTYVLVMYMHIDTQIVHNAFYASEEENWEPEDFGWWSYVHSEVSRTKLDDWMTPTHWMPLPSPPQALQG